LLPAEELASEIVFDSDLKPQTLIKSFSTGDLRSAGLAAPHTGDWNFN
jgi:hypothetical protein